MKIVKFENARKATEQDSTKTTKQQRQQQLRPEQAC
jgi:hypothetical protein